MKVSEVEKVLALKCHNPAEDDPEVTGGYACDLLSWVIGRAGRGSVWITIMSNVNVAAVALLADVSMIILAEGVTPDEYLLGKARAQGLGLYSAGAPAYELCWRIHDLIK